jgi:hypothetical protein
VEQTSKVELGTLVRKERILLAVHDAAMNKWKTTGSRDAAGAQLKSKIGAADCTKVSISSYTNNTP